MPIQIYSSSTNGGKTSRLQQEINERRAGGEKIKAVNKDGKQEIAGTETYLLSTREFCANAAKEKDSILAIDEVRTKEELQAVLKASQNGCRVMMSFWSPDFYNVVSVLYRSAPESFNALVDEIESIEYVGKGELFLENNPNLVQSLKRSKGALDSVHYNRIVPIIH